MKRFKTLLIVVIGVFCLTGCGGKKLTCSQSATEEGMKTNVEVTLKFSGDEVSNIKMVMDYQAESEELKGSWSMYTGVLDGMFKEMDGKDGVKYSSKADDKNFKYSLTLDIDPSKVAKEVSESLDLEDLKGTYDTVKKEAEAAGFTCK